MEVISSTSYFSEPKDRFEHRSIVGSYGLFNTSFFNTQPTQGSKCEDYFNEFINYRVDYLNGLRNLGDNWISGNSRQPSQSSISYAIDFLKSFNSWYCSNSCNLIVPPKIIMSPIPTGGIGIQLIFAELRFLLSIFDNGIELEKEEEGYYSDVEATADSVLETIMDYLQNSSSVQKINL